MLARVRRSVLKDAGATRADAAAWETEQLAGRLEVERARANRTPGRTLDVSDASHRTVRDLAEYYFEDESFTAADPVTQAKVRLSVTAFLEWNDGHAPTYANQWTATYAKAYRKYISENHQTGGRDFHNIYARKIFQLDLDRTDGSAISSNPFPKPKANRAKRRAKALLQIPRPYYHEELLAIMEHSTPYQRLIWTVLYNLGCRSAELTGLRRDHVTLRDGTPHAVTFFRTKNGLPRKVYLNAEAQDAVTSLLAQADDAGYVIRRDFVKGLKTPLLFYLNQAKRRAVKQYPHLRDGLLGRLPVPDDEPKMMWRTRIKDGVRTKIQVEAKGRFVTNVHTFRKTLVTRLILEGRSIPAIARIIGDNPKTLMERYAGVLDEDLEETICALTPILERPRALKTRPGHSQGTRSKEPAGLDGNRPAVPMTI